MPADQEARRTAGSAPFNPPPGPTPHNIAEQTLRRSAPTASHTDLTVPLTSHNRPHPLVNSSTGPEDPKSMSDAGSEDLEMDSYTPYDRDDAQHGLISPDGCRARQHVIRDFRAPAIDEEEQSLLSADDDPRITKEEKKEADRAVLRSLAVNAILIGLWYLFSLLISVYNKWMFSPEHLNFHFPLFITCLHMIIQFCLSSLVLYALPQFRPAGLFGAKLSSDTIPIAGDTTSQREGFFCWNSRSQERKSREQGVMTNRIYLLKIAPCGAATGLDIGLGNMSLKFISLAFYTMCKSSSLAFVLIFAFAFRLEKITWKLVGIIAVMTIGVVMMVASEAQFVLTGFVLVITASALSGVRWSLTQLLLLKNPATSNPFSSIFYLAPCMFLAILCVAIPVEGFTPLFERFWELVAEWGFILAVTIVVFPGVVAFLMVSSEFALLKRSSVITLSICGIFKEVMTISAAAIIFYDPLTPINISGLLVTIISIACYNYIKISKMRQEAVQQTHAAHHPHGATHPGYAAVSEYDDDDDEPNPISPSVDDSSDRIDATQRVRTSADDSRS